MLVGASTDFTPASASADGSSGVESNPIVVVLAEQYAAEADVVSARLRHVQAVRSAIADWESLYPDSFAGAFHTDGFDASTTVRFVGSVPAAVRTASANLATLADVGEIVFDTTATQSKRDLRSDYLRTVSLLNDAGIQEATTALNIRSQQIEVTLRVDAEVPLPPGYATPESVKSMLDNNGVKHLTLTSVIGALVQLTSGVYGGDKVRRSSDISRCTSAFAVKKGSTKGILTADHCDGLNQYVAFNGDGETYSMSRRAGHFGSDGDMAWYTTSGSEGPWIYRNPSTKDDVASYLRRKWISEGDYFCFYGVATDRQMCGEVTDEEVTVSYEGESIGNQVRMEGSNLESLDGDSGAPWYEGAYQSITAVGIMTGHDDDDRQYFTPVHTALTRFGLEILEND